MYDDIRLCLTELLDQDLTSYEYFHSLPREVQQKIIELDLRSFKQIQEYAENNKEPL